METTYVIFCCYAFYSHGSRACDVHPYCQVVIVIWVIKQPSNYFLKRLGGEGNDVCAHYSEEFVWAVDAFHIKGHKVDFLLCNVL